MEVGLAALGDAQRGQTSADPVAAQCLQATCCPVDGAVQEQAHGEERTCHGEAGPCGSRSQAKLLVLLLFLLATIPLLPFSPEAKVLKELFGFMQFLELCI